ncbi:C39 family peptidase [Pseudomonas sp. UBA6562]|uniref:C39 family peptidase n=1 Tax=Pseudomonas sp. UBA6562 TaxID=1947332 RepID=UPI0025F0C600|nr:cysteine peptidase family C39 domain-containing protein [Pseudomonas sp. UBA6562]
MRLGIRIGSYGVLFYLGLCNNVAHSDTGPKIKSLIQMQMSGIERQTLDYSCGAASLAILLKHYFDEPIDEKGVLADIVARLPKEQLAAKAVEGFSMRDLKRAAEHLGYSADGLILDHESVFLLEGPVIILLTRKNLNHFVVLKGVNQGKAFLADPTRGHIRIPLFELFEEWQGETLIVGRDHFGLPQHHRLRLPTGRPVAPELEALRSLRSIPIH